MKGCLHMGKLTKSLWKLFQKGAVEVEEEQRQLPLAAESDERPSLLRRGSSLMDMRKTTLRLEAELVRECKHAAVDYNISFSLLVEVAIRYFLYLLKNEPETAFAILREFNPYEATPQFVLPSKEDDGAKKSRKKEG